MKKEAIAYRAILWGCRSSREISATTLLSARACEIALNGLLRRGQIKSERVIRYPAEAETLAFYEPMESA